MTFNLAVIARFLVSATVLLAASTANGQGFVAHTLVDPVLRMNAYEVNIPAGWKFDGIVSQGTPCKGEPFPVFRAYSPDGLSEFRRLPRFDWGWSNNRVAQNVYSKCMPLDRRLDANEFLHYLSGVMGYQYVADWPMAADDQSYQQTLAQINRNYAQSGMRGYRMTGSLGAARTVIQNGSFTIEQQLLVTILCTDAPLPDGTSTSDCTAQVRALRAPKGKLDALVQMISHPGSGANENPQWRQAMTQAAAARNGEIMRQRDAAFRQWSGVMAHQHEQFMAQMQSEGASRTANFNAHMQTKAAVASDWVDYALNQQTVSGSGGVQKVSSAYGQTWSNGQGQWYQTNDPNANPNGVLSGTWTVQQQVHGNGTP